MKKNTLTAQETLVRNIRECDRRGLRAKNVDKHGPLYEQLYLSAAQYMERVLLRSDKNRRRLHVLQMDLTEASHLLSQHIFWYKLDYLMETAISGDDAAVLKTITVMASNKLADLLRVKKEEQFLGEEGWILLSHNSDVEEEVYVHDECRRILRTLSENPRPLEAIAFLSTRALGIKTGEVAKDLLSLSHAEDPCRALALYFCRLLAACSGQYALPDGFFEAAAFLSEEAVLSVLETLHETDDPALLSAHLSRCADRSSRRIRTLMTESRHSFL
ncbi:MAG: hypothetical protein J5935_04830 [Lachnospiraceae bacterium]|nr:hypothetical protein [Lachnospiraceae bacterium]